MDTILVSDENYIMDIKEFNDEISSLYNEYKSLMESLELEDSDWEDYSPRHSGYIPEWEATQHMAEDEADELFSFFNETITSLLLQDRIEDVLIELISFFYATQDADIDDPYNNLGDSANDYFLEKLNGYFDYCIKKINITKIADERILNSINFFFKYFETEQQECYKDIKIFENLLVLLIEKIDGTENLLPLNKITSINIKYCPVLAITIEDKLGNNDAWIEQAHLNLFGDTKIGEKLLNYYSDKDIQEYYVVATKLFDNNKRFWAKYLHDKIDYRLDKTLYTNIFYQLVIDENKIEYYNKVKTFLTTEDYNKLIEEKKHNKTFLVAIFEADNKYSEIKNIVEQNLDFWDYEKLISPILNVYPLFCFEGIKEKATKIIERERGREAYIRIASLLKLAKKITGYESQVQNLVEQLYNNKPNLPALKSEFKIAGLM
jgi:hypothetical protein